METQLDPQIAVLNVIDEQRAAQPETDPMNRRPRILDAIADKAYPGAFIKFREGWRPGDDNKYFQPKDTDSKPLPLTDDVRDDHWARRSSIGFYVMAPGSSTTRLGAIDFDNHVKDGVRPRTADDFLAKFRTILECARARGLHPIAVRTSDDGFHALFMWTEPVESAAVRSLLAAVVRDAGIVSTVERGPVEVYPKQDALKEGEHGSGLSLIGGRDSALLDADLQPLPRDAWDSVHFFVCPVPAQVQQAEPAREPRRLGVVEAVNRGDMVGGGRNDTLKALLRRRRDVLGDEELEMLADGFGKKNGMSEREVSSLVKWALSLPKSDVEGFTGLTKVVPKHRTRDADGHYWIDYAGMRVYIPTTHALRSAATVAEAILSQADVYVELRVADWRETLRQLVSRMTVSEVEGETAADSIWYACAVFLKRKTEFNLEYLTVREGLLQGYPVLDEQRNRLVFLPDTCLNWINRTQIIKGKIDRGALLEVIRARGIGGTDTFSVANKNYRVYWVEMDAVLSEVDTTEQLELVKPIELAEGGFRGTREQFDKSISEFIEQRAGPDF